jgi:heptose I phosphotransferase
VEASEKLIARNRLTDFDIAMRLLHTRIVKHTVFERITAQVELKSDGLPVSAFLKRSYPVPAATFIRRLISGIPRHTAFTEWNNIIALHRSGIPTMLPIAAGRRRRGFFQYESFLLTRTLEGCVRLDSLLKQDLPNNQKRLLIYRTACLVKNMHSRGFNHRDLYLCHILCRNPEELFIVDLHRMEHRLRVPRRLRVKDIAALNYAALGCGVSRADRLRFFYAYAKTSKLHSSDKRFIFSVLKKTEKMVKHNEKHSR